MHPPLASFRCKHNLWTTTSHLKIASIGGSVGFVLEGLKHAEILLWCLILLLKGRPDTARASNWGLTGLLNQCTKQVQTHTTVNVCVGFTGMTLLHTLRLVCVFCSYSCIESIGADLTSPCCLCTKRCVDDATKARTGHEPMRVEIRLVPPSTQCIFVLFCCSSRWGSIRIPLCGESFNVTAIWTST